MRPDLDSWIPTPVVRVHHRREADVDASVLWDAARAISLADTRTLGRLVRLRIPGVPPLTAYDEMFRSPPFNVLVDDEGLLVSGLVGLIWTLKRDYPTLADPEEFRSWSARGTVRVLFGNWVEARDDRGAVLINETRVDAVDRGARAALAALRPLITRSHNLIGSEGLEIAVQRAEQSRQTTS